MTVSGIVQVHSAVAALRSHVEWAVEAAFGMPVALSWQAQPAAVGQFKCEFPWRGEPAIVDVLGSNLLSCRQIRFEIVQDAAPGQLGRRISYTPDLGVFNGVINEFGDLVVTESQLRSAMQLSRGEPRRLATRLTELLANPWDDELEAFRYGEEQVRWLHAVN